MSNAEVLEQVERGYRMKKPTSHHLPDEMYELMLQCWNETPKKRPTFEFLSYYFENYSTVEGKL